MANDFSLEDIDAEIERRKMASQVSLDDIDAEIAKRQKQPTVGRAARVGVESGLTFGARPTVAGVGAGAGAFVGALESGAGIGEAFTLSKKAFSEARQEAIEEEDVLAEVHPGTTIASKIGGAVATAPLTAVKGLLGAARLGAIQGTGEAIGRAKTPQEAALSIGGGAALGVVGQAATSALSAGVRKSLTLARRVFPKKAATKIAATLTGVPDDQIADYASRSKEINKIIKEVGGDFQEATNVAKEKLLVEIRNARLNTGKIIGKTLDGVSEEKFIPAQVVLDKIDNVMGKLDDVLETADIEELKGFKDIILRRAGESKKLSVGELFKVKEFLQDKSKGAFLKQGQIFSNSKNVKRAAKGAYLQAKDLLDDVSPAIKGANSKLHKLHVLEERMNKSLIKPGAAEGSFLQAGAGINKRNQATLKRLGELTGFDVLDEAKKLSTARAFTSPELIPRGQTGKTLTRLVTGGAVGGALAGVGGFDESTGAMIGAALSSPLALKALINSGRLGADATKNAISFAAKPEVRSIIVRQFSQDAYNKMNRLLKRGK
jgi:hypothetical protein